MEWTGGMLGIVHDGTTDDFRSAEIACGVSAPCTFDEAKATLPNLLTGDVSFTLSAAQIADRIEEVGGNRFGHGDGYYPFSISISNISDQAGNEQESWTWEGRLRAYDRNFVIGSGDNIFTMDSPHREGLSGHQMRYHFYGPNHGEVGGSFRRWTSRTEQIIGAFGAKR